MQTLNLLRPLLRVIRRDPPLPLALPPFLRWLTTNSAAKFF
jgi:hypothetical protein